MPTPLSSRATPTTSARSAPPPASEPWRLLPPTPRPARTRRYLLLTINRGKLYRLSTVASNKRWSKREEMYKNVVLSFVPKGF